MGELATELRQSLILIVLLGALLAGGAGLGLLVG
jgi:hypothetical protein